MEFHREKARIEKAKIEGKVSERVALLVSRYYLMGYFKKPLEQMTDEDFLSQLFVGPKTLAEIRKVIPKP